MGRKWYRLTIMDLEPTAEEAEVLAEIRGVLTTQFRLRGHGTKKRILGKIGMSTSTLDMSFSRGSLKVIQLLRLLKELNIDPGQFLREAIPAKLDEPLPKERPPRVVRIGQRRRAGK